MVLGSEMTEVGNMGLSYKKEGDGLRTPSPPPFQTRTVVALHSRKEVTFVPGQTRQNCNS